MKVDRRPSMEVRSGDAVQAVMGDDSIQGQLAEMSDNPEVLRQTQEQSEVLLKKVAAELVEGVKEYRDEFEPNADDLITKFGEIAENGYESFLKYSMSDVNVKNAARGIFSSSSIPRPFLVHSSFIPRSFNSPLDLRRKRDTLDTESHVTVTLLDCDVHSIHACMLRHTCVVRSIFIIFGISDDGGERSGAERLLNHTSQGGRGFTRGRGA